jgi:hypothetical protein
MNRWTWNSGLRSKEASEKELAPRGYLPEPPATTDVPSVADHRRRGRCRKVGTHRCRIRLGVRVALESVFCPDRSPDTSVDLTRRSMTISTSLARPMRPGMWQKMMWQKSRNTNTTPICRWEALSTYKVGVLGPPPNPPPPKEKKRGTDHWKISRCVRTPHTKQRSA